VSSLLCEIDRPRLRLNFHPGQWRAWNSHRRFVAVLAGTQSGKTALGPWWLHREILDRGPGDYIAATATYDLFKLKMLPALRETFVDVLKIGKYWSGDRIIELADPTTREFKAHRVDDPMWGRIILRSAESDGGLESTTGLAAWLDEAGQDSFRAEAWEAILRRLSLSRGRVLLTTTLYNFGWLKTQVYDRWKAGDTSYDVVHFDSTENPLFSQEEMERARASMPEWRWQMQYRGRYERPAGLIYDSFSDDYVPRGHLIPRFALDPKWPRYLGLDFGGVNTAGMFYAAEPGTSRLYAYREYLAGGRTAREHAEALKAGEPMIPVCVGGSKSEGQWRDEFRAGGLPVMPPEISDVEVGIGRVYGAHKRDEIIVFDDLRGYLDQKRSYSRKLDAAGQPTEVIEDKHKYHWIDAERYIIGYLRSGQVPIPPRVGGSRSTPTVFVPGQNSFGSVPLHLQADPANAAVRQQQAGAMQMPVPGATRQPRRVVID
jgi:hypothetical protein